MEICKGLLAPRAQQAPPDLKGLREKPGRKAFRASRAPRGRPGRKVRKEKPAPRGPRESRGCKGRKGRKDPKAPRDCKAWEEPMAKAPISPP